LLANEASHGKRALPSYNLDKAKLIVSLGADFLGTWLSPTEFNRLYAVGRKVSGEKPELSRHVQFESMMSLTGSNADDRYIHAPSQTGAIALALLQKMGGATAGPAIADAALNKGIEKTAALLASSKGSAVVLCGSNDVNIQMVVNALNEAIGANGTIIDFNTTNNTRKGIDADMVQLTNDMASGAIGGLLVYDCNPVYSYADSAKFAAALSKLPLSVSFNSTMDETTELCKYLIPSHHWLESWGDAEPKSGNISLIQPVINPLFKTRPFQSSLLKWAGVNTGSGMTPVTVSAVNKPDSSKASDTTGVQMAPMPAQQYTDPYENFYTKYWSGKLGSTENWEKALQDGIITIAGSVSAPVVAASTTLAQPVSLEAASAKIAGTKGSPTEVVFYQKVSIGNGSQANNPWLQELPDPISRVTWDNYAMISPAMAKSLLNIDVLNPDHRKQADDYEVHPEKPVIKVTVNGKSLNLPAMIIPGVHPGTIAIALGYGRGGANADLNLDRVGRSATLAGGNAYPMVPFDGNTFVYNAPATAVTTGDVYVLAQTQVHGSTEGRPVIYETNLASFTANPEALLEEARHERAAITPEGKTDYRRDATMYPDFAKPGIKWGMSIDLNTCTGCSACVVACIAENNISVVGKKQVARYHDMHWLRIDRYFTGDMNNPDVVYQPMLCQHCDNAPCENVCPVSATNHSSEGLNQMAYNRCIGTRYCANNCPYKVRRFNWLDYTGADSFPDNQMPLIGDVLDEVTVQMNDNLTRMVLNPDVTVRSRGVMEKCSFCVQRLQDGKLDAKKKQDPSLVRNLKTACSQACPTNAIMFGNVNDSASEVYKIRNVEQTNRNFYVLEQLHTLPNVSYLAKVRNTDRHIGIQEEEHLGELHTEGNNG
ncbi:MAG: 4Fe-4S dicluster domain-containing protein, partial [Ferruginibacter sp.]